MIGKGRGERDGQKKRGKDKVDAQSWESIESNESLPGSQPSGNKT